MGSALFTSTLWSARLTALAGAAVLAAAYVIEYGFGYAPCELCLYQRLPWWIALAVLCVGLAAARRLPGLLPVFTILAGVTILAGAGIAGYHVGVEQDWWAGPAACSGTPGAEAMDLQALKDAVMAAPVIRCDEVPWSLFGISMAGYNFILALIVGGYAVLTGWFGRR